MIGFTYSKKLHKEVPITPPPLTDEERRRLKNLMRFLEHKADAEYARDHINGYCPHCHMLIPSGRTKCECQD